MVMTLILSKTGSILWDNPVPASIFHFIEINSGFKKADAVKLKRHDSLLITSFQHTYGEYLGSCTYAVLVEIPDYCFDVYEIVRMPCFCTSFYPESISIDVERCLSNHVGHPEYTAIKNDIRRITYSQIGVRLGDSIKGTYTPLRFHVIK
jgi:hypothetical protein